MKGYWKILLASALPMLRLAGQAKRDEDANSTGRDDLIGVSMCYAADLLESLLNGTSELPKAPKELR